VYVTKDTIAPDIYANGMLEDMPEKATTPQYIYTFGLRDDREGNYVEYSGWKKANTDLPSLSGYVIQDDNVILEPYFSTTEREYTIRWLLNNGQVVSTSKTTVKYNGSYDKLAPTITDIHKKYETCSVTISNAGEVTYNIFDGWDKIPNKI